MLSMYLLFQIFYNFIPSPAYTTHTRFTNNHLIFILDITFNSHCLDDAKKLPSSTHCICVLIRKFVAPYKKKGMLKNTRLHGFKREAHLGFIFK